MNLMKLHPIQTHSSNQPPMNISRRRWLQQAMGGFGALALNGLLADSFGGTDTNTKDKSKSGSGALAPHHRPHAKSVIFLYMEGGPSQVDTFDYKPELQKRHGEILPFQMPATVFNTGNRLMASPFEFQRYGQSGAWVSSLFPHLSGVVDDLTLIHSMRHESSNHTSACYFSHTGSPIAGRPAMGSWITYGLGTENQSLPGFITLDCGQGPSGGAQTWGNGFLPANYQGVPFMAGPVTVEFIDRQEKTVEDQQRKLELIRRLNLKRQVESGASAEIETLISHYEKAARMQAAVPELMDLDQESEATKKLYGLDQSHCSTFGSRCLIARRLVERGVRFIELFSPRVKADRWDQHGALKQGIQNNAIAVDQPIAGLIKDLKSRGLLDQTIVVWGGEFGRTPVSQGGSGRDHNPFGYTMWVAGGGFQPGIQYGATDEFGYYAQENPVHLHDLHATILHQLGINHERLTFRHAGRNFRLTDVHGKVIRGILNTLSNS
jgi:hypothetical protein